MSGVRGIDYAARLVGALYADGALKSIALRKLAVLLYVAAGLRDEKSLARMLDSTAAGLHATIANMTQREELETHSDGSIHLAPGGAEIVRHVLAVARGIEAIDLAGKEAGK